MDPATQAQLENLGISVALGFVVGLQRQRNQEPIAGLRTFPLITSLGTLAAILDTAQGTGGWIIASGLLAVAAIALTTNSLQLRREEKVDYGTTTILAVLVMYVVGANLVIGHRLVSIAVGAGVAVLLQFKPELHGIAARLGDEDLRAIMTFVLISGIVLPVLPNRTYDVPMPLNILNPFEIWLMVVLIVGISLGGYLIYKFVGGDAGVILVGLLGGAISSTATTASVSRRARFQPDGIPLASLVILIASTVVYGRVLIEIGVVAPQLFMQLAPPVVIPMLAGIVTAIFVWLRSRHDPGVMPKQRNPSELRPAIVFGLFYACVLMALTAVRTLLGEQSLYVVAMFSGLTDMDAITLSSARMARISPEEGGILPDTAWRMILVASMSNLVFKGSLAAIIGHRALGQRMIWLFAPPFLAAVGVLLLWPA